MTIEPDPAGHVAAIAGAPRAAAGPPLWAQARAGTTVPPSAHRAELGQATMTRAAEGNKRAAMAGRGPWKRLMAVPIRPGQGSVPGS